jgi:predicted transcriptional regulator
MDFLNAEDKDEKRIIFDIFDMNDLEKDIFQALRDRTLTVQEVADEVGRSRSTVQRALQDMLDKDVLMREGKTDKTVYYVYTALPMEEIREVASDALKDWHQTVQNKLG